MLNSLLGEVDLFWKNKIGEKRQRKVLRERKTTKFWGGDVLVRPLPGSSILESRGLRVQKKGMAVEEETGLEEGKDDDAAHFRR